MEHREIAEKLFERYYEAVLSYCLAKLGGDEQAAADAAGDVFADAARKAELLSSHPDPEGWLFKAARCAVKTTAKKRARYRSRFVLFDPAALDSKAFDSDTELRRWEKRVTDAWRFEDPELVRRFTDEQISELKSMLLSSLKDEERRLFSRRYEDGVSAKELAREYGISEAAVRMRLSRISAKVIARVKIYFDEDRSF